MLRGRDSIEGSGMWRWADEGERWLRENFRNLDFHTFVDLNKRTVTLTVYRAVHLVTNGASVMEKIFVVEEPVESFVSHLTTTKIILLAG